MPTRAPRICRCGKLVAFGLRCECMAAGERARKAAYDAKRPSSSARGYTGAWDRAKAAWLKVHPRCRFCGGGATTVDHIRPHKGDSGLFWDKSNWQALCAPCHNSAKQRIERRAKGKV